MAGEVLLTQRPTDRIRLLTLNRPDRLNAMSRLVVRLRETPQPIIAAVNGPAAAVSAFLEKRPAEFAD